MLDCRTLYLVSAEQSGKGFWKVGTTKSENPLIDINSGFLECYRKEILGIDSALEIKEAITINLSNILSLCKNEGFSIEQPPQGFSFDLPLVLLEEIYDFWLETYKQPDEWNKYYQLLKCRSKLSFSNQFILKGLTGTTAKYASIIEELHSYRPQSLSIEKTQNDPMWI